MKITLVMPGVGRKPGERYVASWNMQPLSLAVLAALTPADVDVRLVDDRCEAIAYDEPTDAVAINVETYTARRGYAIAARFRARGVPVILGGYHPTLAPDEAQQHADAIVQGPAEGVWPQVVADLRAGRLQPSYLGTMRDGTVVRPRRSVFHGKQYQPLTLIETGRGCRFACDFCSIAGFYRQAVTGLPLDDVVAEVHAAEHRDIFFVDDNIVADPDRARRLFAAIAPAGIRWFGQGSIDMARDTELLRLMRQSGCGGVLIGFESLSAATLAAMGKSWNRAVQDYQQAVARLRDAGIPVYATFVFGYDTDDADAFERTVEFAIGQKFHMAAFNHLVPFPGTGLYERLRREKRLRFDPWWLDEHYRFGDVAFHPKNMSAEELAERCFQARRDFYRFGSIIHRACDLRANCRNLHSAAAFFWLNFFSGRQMQKRQGLPLGEGFDDSTGSMPAPATLREVAT